MADVTFHNVQHGEYISIAMKTEKNEDLTVIRDFGAYSDSLKSLLETEADKMATDENLKEAILSHAHRDHCNGFELLHQSCQNNNGRILNPPFRKAYIPYLRFKEDDDFGALMLKVGLYYLYILPLDSIKTKRITNWIKMTPIMYDLSEMLVGVWQGFVFPDWSQKGTVLWPPAPKSDYCQKLVFDLTDTVNILEQTFPNDVKNIINQVYDGLRSALHSFTDAGKQSLQSTALNIINSVLDPYLKECGNAVVQLEPALCRKCDKVLMNIDNHSIVFSLDAEDGSDGILFLSDLDAPSMNRMCEVIDREKHYKAIKSAHHGTRLGKKLAGIVKSDLVIHCCGQAHQNYNGPNPPSLTPSYFSIAQNNICSDWIYNHKKWINCSKYSIFNCTQYIVKI